MVLVIIFIVAVIMYRVLIAIPLFQNNDLRSKALMIASGSAACVNLILIMALGKVYEKLALKLTQWGEYRSSHALPREGVTAPKTRTLWLRCIECADQTERRECVVTLHTVQETFCNAIFRPVVFHTLPCFVHDSREAKRTPPGDGGFTDSVTHKSLSDLGLGKFVSLCMPTRQ